MPTPAEIFRQTIEHFTTEFLYTPYLCYTEHGLHARFYAQLYHALAPEQRYLYSAAAHINIFTRVQNVNLWRSSV